MKKLCALFPLLFLIASANAFAATSEDLVQGIIKGDIVLTAGIRSFRSLSNELNYDTLPGRLLSLFAYFTSEDLSISVDGAEDAAFCASFTPEGELETFLAAEKRSSGYEDALPDIFDSSADFSLLSPNLALALGENTPWGTVRAAKIFRDGETYLVITNGSPEVFEKAASSKASQKRHTGDNIYVRGNCDISNLAGLPGAESLKFEIGLSATETTIQAHIWSNAYDVLNNAVGGRLNAAFVQEEEKEAPLLLGSDPLMVLVNISLPLKKGVPLEDFLAGTLLDSARKELASLNKKHGWTWDDVSSALRGNVTVGIGGRLSILGMGYPGAWIHARGISESRASQLVARAWNRASRYGAKLCEIGEWSGFRCTFPVPFAVFSGPGGFVAALMGYEQLSISPEMIPTLLEIVTEPHAFAAGFSGSQLLPAVRCVDSDLGIILSLFGSEEQAYQLHEKFQKAISVLEVVDSGVICTTGRNSLFIEFTPKEEMLWMFRP